MTTTTTTVDVSTIEPIGHREGVELGRIEYGRFADALETLGADDWARPTDCEGWTVRDLAGHVVGAMRSAASLREQASQMREIKGRVKADGGNEVDHMTAVQLDRVAHLTTDELVAECRELVDRAAAGRRRVPAPMRRFVKIPVEMGSIDETWRLGYLLDVILTRDIWLHRVDLGRAVEADPVQDADHDARIVEDIVAEWARRHGAPFTLHLDGPAGGHFRSGDGDGPTIELDTVDYCRILSGRAEGEGLLTHEVPF